MGVAAEETSTCPQSPQRWIVTGSLGRWHPSFSSFWVKIIKAFVQTKSPEMFKCTTQLFSLSKYSLSLSGRVPAEWKSLKSLTVIVLVAERQPKETKQQFLRPTPSLLDSEVKCEHCSDCTTVQLLDWSLGLLVLAGLRFRVNCAWHHNITSTKTVLIREFEYCRIYAFFVLIFLAYNATSVFDMLLALTGAQ